MVKIKFRFSIRTTAIVLQCLYRKSQSCSVPPIQTHSWLCGNQPEEWVGFGQLVGWT